MKIRKSLHVSAFTFIALNLVKKEAVLHIFLIMWTMQRELYKTGNRYSFPVVKGRKLNVRRTFNVRPVSTGSNAEHFLRKIMEILYPALSWKLEESALILGKKVLILVIYRLNFSFKTQFLSFYWRQSLKFFPVWPFVFVFLMNIKVS